MSVSIDGQNVLATGLEEVGFSQTDATVNEQGVVGFAGLLCDGDGRGVGKAITGALNKIIERIIGGQQNLIG